MKCPWQVVSTDMLEMEFNFFLSQSDLYKYFNRENHIDIFMVKKSVYKRNINGIFAPGAIIYIFMIQIQLSLLDNI